MLRAFRIPYTIADVPRKETCHDCREPLLSRSCIEQFVFRSTTMLQDEILFSSLQELIDRGSIREVVSVLKSGKEATVCCCRDRHGGLVAAKVYRPLEHRRFRNDQVYRGGKVLKGRAQRALDNKSDHGRAVQLGTWQHYEWETINLMHEIGSDVPRPIERSAGVIVMEYVGGDESTPAPQLRAVRSM